jgi:hypothetical protein
MGPNHGVIVTTTVAPAWQLAMVFTNPTFAAQWRWWISVRARRLAGLGPEPHISDGGVSVFDVEEPITPEQGSSLESDESVIDEAVARLEAARFEVLQRTSRSLNISGLA